MGSLCRQLMFVIGLVSTLPFTVHAQPKITIDHNDSKTANVEFKFKSVPQPSRNDAATNAKLIIVDGEADPNGADPKGTAPLIFAASEGNSELVEMLLTAGADVNAHTRDGLTAMMAAGLADRWDLVNRLKEAGAKE